MNMNKLIKMYGCQTYIGFYINILANHVNGNISDAKDMFIAMPKENKKNFLYEILFGSMQETELNTKKFFFELI